MNELLFGPPADLSVHDINPGGDINLVSPVMDKSWLNTTPQEQAPATAKKLQEDKDNVSAKNMFEDFTKRNAKEIAQNTKTQQLYTPYSQARKFEGFQDEGLYFNPDDEYLDDVYRGAQGPLDRIGNYAAQTLGNAAASFAGSFLEIPSVIAAANATAGSDKTDVLGKLADGSRALWDNPLVASIDEANKKWQDHFYNFSTEGERKNPFWGKILTGSLLGEMVASSGMALGAIAGAIVETAAVGLATGGVGDVPLFALKAKKFVDYVPELLESLVKANKVINATGDTYQNARSIFNTTKNLTGNIDFAYKSTKLADKMFSVNMITNNFYEGALEAIQAVEELKGTLAEQYKAKTGYDPDGNELKKIEDQANRAGNMVFGANVALLALTNKFEFGDLVRRSQIGEVAYKAEKNKIADLAIDGIDGIKSNQKAVKAVAAAADPLKPPNFLSKTSNFVKNRVSTSLIRESLGEGVEEGAQMSIENFSQDYYAHNYTDAAYNVANAVGRAVGKTLTSQEGWASILSGIGSGALTSGGLQLAGVQQKDVPVDAATAALHIAQLSSSGKLSDLVARKASSKVAGGTKAGSIQSEALRAETETEKEKSVQNDIFNWATTAHGLGYGDIRKMQIAEARKLEGENFKLAFGIEYNDKNKKIVNETLDQVDQLFDKATRSLDKVNVVYKNPYNIKKEPDNFQMFQNYKNELAYHLYNNDNNISSIKKFQQAISAMDGSIGFGEELTSLTNGKTEVFSGIVDGALKTGFAVDKKAKFGLPLLREGYTKELKELQALTGAGITEARTTKKIKELEDLVQAIDKHIANDDVTEEAKVDLIHAIRGMNTRYDDGEDPDYTDSILIKRLLDRIDRTRALLERSAGIINALNGKTGFDKFKTKNDEIRQASVERIQKNEKKARDQADKDKAAANKPDTTTIAETKTTEQKAEDQASTTAKDAFTTGATDTTGGVELTMKEKAQELVSSKEDLGRVVIVSHNGEYKKIIQFQSETESGYYFFALNPKGQKKLILLTKDEVEARYKQVESSSSVNERYEKLYDKAVEDATNNTIVDKIINPQTATTTTTTEPVVEPTVEQKQEALETRIDEANLESIQENAQDPIDTTPATPEETINRNPIDILEPQEDIEETSDTEEKDIPDGLAFNLKGGVKAVFNRRTKGFDFYTKKGNKVKSHVKMKKYSKELTSKPNMIQSWWNDLIDENTKEDVLYHLRELMDQYQQGMNDAEAVIDLQGLIMQNIKGAKFTPGQIDGYVTDVDRGRWVSDTGGTPLDTFVTGTLQDILRDNGFDMDESEIIEAVLSIIQSYPKGISAQSLKNHLESTDPMRMVYAIQDTFIDRFGLDIDQVLTKLQQELTDAEQTNTNEPEPQDQADIAPIEGDIQKAETIIPTETGEELLLNTTVADPIQEEPVALDNEEENVPDSENPLLRVREEAMESELFLQFLTETGQLDFQAAFDTFKEIGKMNPYEYLLKVHNRGKVNEDSGISEEAHNVWTMLGSATMDQIRKSISGIKKTFKGDAKVKYPLDLVDRFNRYSDSILELKQKTTLNKSEQARLIELSQQRQEVLDEMHDTKKHRQWRFHPDINVYNFPSESRMDLFYTGANGNRLPLGPLFQGSNFVYLSRLERFVDFENIFEEVDTFTAQDFKDLGIQPSQEGVLRAAIIAYRKSNYLFREVFNDGDIDNETLSHYYDWGFFENTRLLLNPFSKPHFVKENAITTVEIEALDEDGIKEGSSRRPMIFDRQGAFFNQATKGITSVNPSLELEEIVYYNQVMREIKADPKLNELMERVSSRYIMITSYKNGTGPNAKTIYKIVAIRPSSIIESNALPFDALAKKLTTVGTGMVTDKDLFYIANGNVHVVYDMVLKADGLTIVPKEGNTYQPLFSTQLLIPAAAIEAINNNPDLSDTQKYEALAKRMNSLMKVHAKDLVTNKMSVEVSELLVAADQFKTNIPIKDTKAINQNYGDMFYSPFTFNPAGLVTMSQPKVTAEDIALYGSRTTVRRTDAEKAQEQIVQEVADPIQEGIEAAETALGIKPEVIVSTVPLQGSTLNEARTTIETLTIAERASLAQRMGALIGGIENATEAGSLERIQADFEKLVEEVAELDDKTFTMIMDSGAFENAEDYEGLIVGDSDIYLAMDKLMSDNRYKFQQSPSTGLDNLPFLLYDGVSIETLVDKFKRECRQ